MGLLRLAVFGTPEVFHDERRLRFALRKAEALLLYLAVEGGLHSRSQLAALLWPDSELSTARNALRNALALLERLSAWQDRPGLLDGVLTLSSSIHCFFIVSSPFSVCLF
jgi:DNA-binding SARP family transcriptional activator